MKLIFNIGYNFENSLAYILSPDDSYSQEVTNSYYSDACSIDQKWFGFASAHCKNKDLAQPQLVKYKKIL